MSAQPQEPNPAETAYRPPRYRRLIGRHRPLVSLAGSSQHAWLADDHLLHVSEGVYIERYQRFYFRDIEAITLRQNRQRRQTGLLLLLIAALWLVLVAIIAGLVAIGSDGGFDDPQLFLLWFGVLTALGLVPCGVLALVNWAQGPTSELHVYTRVQCAELPAFRRLRRARPAFLQLRERIEAAQGAVPPEEVPARLETATLAAAVDRAIGQRRDTGAPRVETGRFHLAAYGLMVVSGLISVTLAPVTLNPWFNILGVLLALVIVTCTLMAIAGQRRSTVPNSLRTLTWGVLIYTAFSVVLSLGYGMVLGFFTFAFDPMAALEEVVQSSGARMLVVVTGAIELLLGIPGLAMTLRYRRQLFGERAAVDPAPAAEAPAEPGGGEREP